MAWITSLVLFLTVMISMVPAEIGEPLSHREEEEEDYLSKVCGAHDETDPLLVSSHSSWEPPACWASQRLYDTPPSTLTFLWMLSSFIHTIWNSRIVPSFLLPIYVLSVFLYIGILSLDHFSRGTLLRRRTTKDRLAASALSKTPLQQQQQQLSVAPPPTTRVPPEAAPVPADSDQPIDMSGSYQMKSADNLDAFLAIQGVPWPLRRAAAAVYPIHHISHVQNRLRIKIEAKSSGFVTETQYLIAGPPVETNVRGRIFSDRVYYSYVEEEEGNGPKRCQGIVTEKRAITEGYVVTVLRKLVHDPAAPAVQILMTSTASFPNEPDKADIVCTQVFERID